MFWFKRYLKMAARMMPISKALEILGLNINELKNKSKDEISKIVKKRRNELAIKYHPDKVTGEEAKKQAHIKMVEINNAYDAIVASGFNITNNSSTSNPFNAGDPSGDFWEDLMRKAREAERERAKRKQQQQNWNYEDWKTTRQKTQYKKPNEERKQDRNRSEYKGPEVNESDFEDAFNNFRNKNENFRNKKDTRTESTWEYQQKHDRKVNEWFAKENAARKSGKVPPWAVEWDVNNFKVGNDISDYRYCQKEIYEQSMFADYSERDKETVTIWEFVDEPDTHFNTDGRFTNMIRVFTNRASIDNAIKIAQLYFDSHKDVRDSNVTPSILIEYGAYNRSLLPRKSMTLVRVGLLHVQIDFLIFEGNHAIANDISEVIKNIKRRQGYK